ncbi:MAG: (2Fe-2S)-binding protein [Desulfobacterales bacterium]|nr:(2Fe-2S)-binding protein [Desulfobacterales bacterium]
MEISIELKINGRIHQLHAAANRTLLEVLRETVGLTGTKKGCGTGECGACTVLLDGVPVNSCLVLALDARGKEITTIEGLAVNGVLHPLQKAFAEHGATQCGFCTPGMILSGKALLDRNPKPTEMEVRQVLSGNLCRCTGYLKPVEAILAVSRSERDTLSTAKEASNLER